MRDFLWPYIDFNDYHYQSLIERFNDFEFYRKQLVLEGGKPEYPDQSWRILSNTVRTGAVAKIYIPNHLTPDVCRAVIDEYKIIDVTAIKGKVLDDYYQFSVVRNPLNRLISMYNYGQKYGHTIVDGKIDHHSIVRFSCFEDFLDNVEYFYQLGSDFRSNWFDSQLDWIQPIYKDSEHEFFRIEEIDSWLPRLCNKLDLKYKPLLHVNSVENQITLTQEQTKRCMKFLEEEFVQLGYL